MKGADSFSIFAKAQRVPAGLRVGLDIFASDLTTFIQHLEFQAVTFLFLHLCKTVCSTPTASPVLQQPPRRRRPMSPFHLHSHSMDPGRESQNLLTFVFRRFWATWRKSLDLERAAWLSWVDLEENIPRFTSVQSSINVDIEVICLLGLKEFCGKPC